MGCRSCGSKSRFSKNIPILDGNNNVVSENYQKYQKLSKSRPRSRVRVLPKGKPNVKKNTYQNLTIIENKGKRVNVLTYDPVNYCIYIVGWMQGCGSCNYMKRLINKIVTPELGAKIKVYVLDKAFTDPKGFEFTGNPTILFVKKGKLVFQVGGIFNKIQDKIHWFYMQ